MKNEVNANIDMYLPELYPLSALWGCKSDQDSYELE